MPSFAPPVTIDTTDLATKSGLLQEHSKRGFQGGPDEMFDHVFEERAIVTLGADSKALWIFHLPHDQMPVINYMSTLVEPDHPVVAVIEAWVNSDGQTTPVPPYAGVRIRGYRSQALPVLTPVSGILTAVIDGVNAIVNLLSGYKPFRPAPGAQIHLRAGAAA